MTKEEIKKRQMVSYPPLYLKDKADAYSLEKGKNGKPQSDSLTIIEALNFFFKHKDKILEK